MILILALLKSYSFKRKLIKSICILLLIFLLIILYMFIQRKNRQLKIKFDSLPLYLQNIIINYISEISPKYIYEREKEKYKLVSLLSLIDFSNISNISLKSELKQKLLKELQTKKQNKNLSQIKGVFVEKSLRYGNSLVLLNNLLYYLNSKKNWPIFENITSNTINITLIPKKDIDFNERSITCFHKNNIYYQKVIKPEVRINRLKYEIKHNLPKIIVNQNDLFIHIRSGDVFKYKYNKNINYAQPPLCFYISVLNTFKFRKIHIISQDRLNPIIDLLIKNFPEILLTNNSLQEDVSLIMNAYNIVGSISSFFTTIIIFNDNLRQVWEYDLYRLPEKYLHLHRDIYNYQIKYSIYKMNPSKNYKSKMFPWRNTKQQRDLMINEKCKNFRLILPKVKII